MRNRPSEELPLIPREDARKDIALTTFNRCVAIGNAPGLLRAVGYPISAYPELYSGFNSASKYLSLPLCAGNLALTVMADRKHPTAEAYKSKAEYAETGLNTFNFFLGFYIATYVAAYAAINKVGENEVDTSDAAYLLGFVAPAALVGLAHIWLEATKSSWNERVTHKQKFLDGAHSVVSTLYNAGTLNEIMLLMLAGFNIGESGKMDPNLRLGLFSIALVAGLGFQVLSHQKPNAVQPVKWIINATTAANYLSSFFVEREGAAPDNTFRAVAGATFVTLGAASLISSVLYPEIKELEVERAASAPPEGDVPLRDLGSPAESEVSSAPATPFYSARSSPTFFSCKSNSNMPSRAASAPDLTELDKDGEEVVRKRSGSF